jgi:hypothetical protein
MCVGAFQLCCVVSHVRVSTNYLLSPPRRQNNHPDGSNPIKQGLTRPLLSYHRFLLVLLLLPRPPPAGPVLARLLPARILLLPRLLPAGLVLARRLLPTSTRLLLPARLLLPTRLLLHARIVLLCYRLPVFRLLLYPVVSARLLLPAGLLLPLSLLHARPLSSQPQLMVRLDASDY